MSGITRKHFTRAAEIVRAQPPQHQHAVAMAFVELFEEDNERFNYETFMYACGFEVD